MDKKRLIENKLGECEYPHRWQKEKSPSADGDIADKLVVRRNENLMILDELPFL